MVSGFANLREDGVRIPPVRGKQRLASMESSVTMTDLARITRMPKQQMTKLVNRLVEQELVKRIYDPADRRIIKIQLTEKATDYIDGFLKNEAGCFRPLLDTLSEEDAAQFKQALILLHGVLKKIPYDWNGD